MVKLMSDQYSMFSLWTSPGSRNVTSSQGSVDGRMHSGLPDGLTINRYGRDHVHASHLASRDQEGRLMTKDICGRIGLGLSESASLQSYLESRLRANMASLGSTLYRLTWKKKDTPLGRQYCQLVASALHTSGSVSGGVPTPSGTSNHGKNHVAGRLDEWGGSSNPFRGTSLGKVHCPAFELWVMGYPAAWIGLTEPETP